MGIRDAQLALSDSQDLTGLGPGTVQSTNVIDFGAPGTDVNGNLAHRDVGMSDLAPDVRVSTAVTSAGAATVQAQVVGYDDAGRTQNRTVYFQSDAIPKATLVQGYRFPLGKIGPSFKQRFMDVEYVIGTAALTAGKLEAGIVLNPTK